VNIEMVGVDTLIPYVNNARMHSDEQVTQIASSIKEFGFNVPILIDKDKGIIAGHGRLMAAKKLGHKEVPTIRLEHLSEVQKKAYILADNKIALNSTWDDELLGVELSDLDDSHLALTGFTDDEVKQLLGEASEVDMPELSSDDKEPFQQMTFTLHDEQAEQIERAIKKSKEMGPFLNTQNENGNGNALARICEIFLTKNGRPEGEYGDS
jgi:ParB-like chromosome segregation protein Spo0J